MNCHKITNNNGKRSFLQNYPKMKKYKIQSWIPYKDNQNNCNKKGKNLTIYYYDIERNNKNISIPDLKKNQISLLPNSIHHIDAEILYLTINKLMKLNVPILAIHDAFYTSFSKINDVKLSYVESYIKVVESQPLLNYIINNFTYLATNNEEFKILYEKLDFKVDNGKFIIKNIKNSTLNKDLKKIHKNIQVIIKEYNSIQTGEYTISDLINELKNNPNLKIID